jgi:hypothetical protein
MVTANQLGEAGKGSRAEVCRVLDFCEIPDKLKRLFQRAQRDVHQANQQISTPRLVRKLRIDNARVSRFSQAQSSRGAAAAGAWRKNYGGGLRLQGLLTSEQ